MTSVIDFDFQQTDIDQIAAWPGRVAVFVSGEGVMDGGARRVNRLTKGAVQRLTESEAFSKMKSGDAVNLPYPAGLAGDALLVVRLDKRPQPSSARRAGSRLAKFLTKSDLLVLAGSNPRSADLALGASMRAYDFLDHKTGDDASNPLGHVTFMVTKPDEASQKAAGVSEIADGVFFTRDLVNEPANILTTENFAERLLALKSAGVKVEVLEEADMAKLGMGALLGVGQGSRSPSKCVVMTWSGGGDEAPFALVGKGVVFDTGGISIKPAAGMEEMTMDMGGAGVVSGVMKTLAARKAKANVVGVVGLVENMPDGAAQRPGDVVTSMKGDTIEVINTDAEGRLVLADILWYTQERFNPCGMINLATLTGAVIIGLGHENAGVFSNNDDFCNAFLKAANTEGEGAWRLPLSSAYDKLLKSRIADMKNIGGRAAGSITAAQFLQRFVKPEVPWIHLDIAGVALSKSDTTMAPKGATGWGVMALNRLISDHFET